ncbi:hypothetical protein [Streptomyces sp. CC224B]|nr:hypothetical protein [Streptomyces sp. CC224B]
MKKYTLTITIEADDDIDADRIREEMYEAGEDVPFSFHIAGITEES